MLFFWLMTLLLLFTFGVPDSTRLLDQGIPEEPSDLKVVKLPKGAEIRYREPGLCETTPVNASLFLLLKEIFLRDNDNFLAVQNSERHCSRTLRRNRANVP